MLLNNGTIEVTPSSLTCRFIDSRLVTLYSVCSRPSEGVFDLPSVTYLGNQVNNSRLQSYVLNIYEDCAWLMSSKTVDLHILCVNMTIEVNYVWESVDSIYIWAV